MNLSPFQRGLAGAVALSVLTFTGVVTAVAQSPAETVFDIPASSLGDALRTFGAQSGTSVAFAESVVAGHTSPGVSGDMSATAALAVLLEGSGLEAVPGAGGYIIRMQSRAPVSEPERPAPASPPERLPPVAREEGAVAAEPAGEPDLRISKVTVTGTSLRGIAPESAPVIIFDRAAILESGASSTEEFLRMQPQTFGGGSSEYSPLGIPGDNNSSFNNTFGSGANLRGLGSGATLTLLDGRRLAPTSQIGDFVDLSMIPVAALERVDILSDGASSIYGGDAVAGVVNFVLRDDFDGAETSLRYGRVTSGDLEEWRLSQTAGTSWSGGNILAVYEYYERDNLTLAERPQIGRPRLVGGAPIGNEDAFDLLPRQERQSLLLSLNQDVGERLSLSGSALYSDRTSRASTVYGTRSVSIFANDASSEMLSVNAGGEYEIGAGWAGSLGLTFSQVKNGDSSQVVVPTLSDPYRTETSSELFSGDLLFNGPLFELPGGTVAAAVGGNLRREEFININSRAGTDRQGTRDVSAVYGELHLPFIGAGNALPGIQRLEANLSARLDDYSDFGTTTNPKAGLLWSPATGLNFRGTYSTSFAPPPLGRTGDMRFDGVVYPMSYVLSALGGVYTPDPSIADVDYLLVSGTARNLEPETSQTWTFGVDHEGGKGPHAWSVNATYYDIDFEGRLGTTPMPLNQSAVAAPFIAFDNPDLLPPGTVTFFPDQAYLAEFVAGFSQPVRFWSGFEQPGNLGNVGIINTASVVRNLASTSTRGIDFRMGYEREIGEARLTAGLSANHILSFSQQATSAIQPVETLNSLRNPVDLQLSGHVGYAAHGFSGSLVLNHLDRYRSDDTPSGQPIGSWTTLDLMLAYRFGERDGDWLDRTSVHLAVRNLFEQAPPRTPSDAATRMPGFDPANASPLLRFVSLELRKSF